MTKEICAVHKPRSTFSRWVMYRGCGTLFVWTGITLPGTVVLTDTPLVKFIGGQYPTFLHFLFDVCFFVFALSCLLILVHGTLVYAKKRGISRKMLAFAEKVEFRFLRETLTSMNTVIEWIAVTFGAVFLWYGMLQPVLIYLGGHGFNAPMYMSQPIVLLMTIFGIALILESFDGWQERLARKFCIECKL